MKKNLDNFLMEKINFESQILAIFATSHLCPLKKPIISIEYVDFCQKSSYRISSYKTLPQIIPAFLTILCSEYVVFSIKTRIRRLCEIIILMCLIWGNTVDLVFSHWYLFFGQSNGKALVVNSSSNIFLNLLVPKKQFHIH